MTVAIVDYGMGNLASVRRAIEGLGGRVEIAKHPQELATADRVVLPGVGAFGEASARLRESGWADALKDEILLGTKPLLGICLGMQLLAVEGEEDGVHPGLGLVAGRVCRIDKLGCRLRVPHVGWNAVSHRDDDPLFESIPTLMDFYFVHSYAFQVDDRDAEVATVTYGTVLAAAVHKGRVFGTQFHPEKSSRAGRQVLENFLAYPSC